MHRNEGPNMKDESGTSRFQDQALPGTAGSTVQAEWGNAATDEIINVILAAGLTPAASAALDRDNGWAQLAQAIFESGAIGANALATDAVTNVKMADDSVSASNIKANTIIASHITSLAVTSTKIGNLAVLTEKIADDAVTNDKMADDSVSASNIKDNTIVAAHITSLAVTSTKIGNGAVLPEKLADSARGYVEQKTLAAPITSVPVGDEASLTMTIPTTGRYKLTAILGYVGTDPSTRSGRMDVSVNAVLKLQTRRNINSEAGGLGTAVQVAIVDATAGQSVTTSFANSTINSSNYIQGGAIGEPDLTSVTLERIY